MLIKFIVIVYPSTWYTLKIDNGETIKLRHSVFRLLSDEEDASIANIHIDANPVSNHSDFDDSKKYEPDNNLSNDKNDPVVYKRFGDSVMLNSLSVDKWRGCLVKIRVGRFLNQTGKVVNMNNSWVIVDLGSEIASKRGHELELIQQSDACGDESLDPPIKQAQKVFESSYSNDSGGDDDDADVVSNNHVNVCIGCQAEVIHYSPIDDETDITGQIGEIVEEFPGLSNFL